REAGVEGFAVVEVGGDDGAEGGFPGGVGADPADGAVGFDEAEDGVESGGLAVVVAHALEAEPAAIPAVGEERAEGVFTGAKMCGDVVGEIFEAVAVIGPAGGEVVGANALAVEVRFKDAARGDVEAGFARGGGEAENFAEFDGGAVGGRGGEGAVNPLGGGPRGEGIEEAGFEPGGRAPGGDGAGVVPDAD